MFENLLVLKKDGNLYRNDKLYDENVEGVWCQSTYTTFIIYKNNDIAHYTYMALTDPYYFARYKKVLYREGAFLVGLDDRGVLGLCSIDTDLPDTFTLISLAGVRDIQYENDALKIIPENEALRMPIGDGESGPMVMTDMIRTAWAQHYW